jgi:hypothetical protein
MADEKTQRALTVGNSVVPIIDPHAVQAVAADLICEAREVNGVVALGFMTVLVTPNADGSSVVEGAVCARLRMTLATAIDLRSTLDTIIKGAMPPKSEVN